MRTKIFPIFSLIILLIAINNNAEAQYGRSYSRHSDRGYYGRSYSSRGYYPYRGERVYLNRPSVYLNFGGYGYHYLDGIFYRPYGSYYEVVAPPIGIHVGILPYGYSRIRVGAGLFYYYNGIYYRPYNNYYEVVTPPVGAEVAELPAGAREVIIDNQRYFDYYGTIYQENRGQNGETWYTVTGKNGEVFENQDNITYENQDRIPQGNPSQSNPSQTVPPQANPGGSTSPNSFPHVGTEVSSLPEGSRTVILNNQKYFIGPDDTYYQEQIDNNQIYYKVVNKPAVRN